MRQAHSVNKIVHYAAEMRVQMQIFKEKVTEERRHVWTWWVRFKGTARHFEELFR